MSKFYEDVGKDSKDLLDKGFPSNGSLKVSVETKTPNGISVNASALRTIKNNKDVVSATVEPKFDWKQHNFELNSKLSTANTFESELAFKDLGTPGSKIAFKGIHDGDNGLSTTANVSFKNENVALKLGGTYPFNHNKPIRLTFNTVFRHKNYLAGVDTAYDTQFEKEDEGKVKEVAAAATVNGTVAYLGEGYEAQVSVKNFPTKDKDFPRDNEISLGWYQKISDYVKLAVNFTLQQSNKVGPSATVGGEYKVDDTTLKGKFAVKNVEKGDAEYKIGLGASQKITPHVQATIGADLNVLRLLGSSTGAEPSFGLEVKFS